ncbi:MAG: hypothetical protein HY908_09840 [Myxococcales bacterium]|nr:hypothetical protein [Myxococcales bacterium]
MRASSVVGALGLLAGLAPACTAMLGLESEYTLGTGGAGTGGTGTGGGGHAGIGGGGQGGSGGGECLTADDCPGSDTTCRYRSCTGHECGMTDAAADTPCDEPPAGQVCDGTGSCVECNTGADCSGADDCVGHVCMVAHCGNGTLDGGESDTDCGGPDCAACINGSSCADDIDCLSGRCDGGTCNNCGSSGDCPTAQHCDPSVAGGTCLGDLPNGDPCDFDTWCLSGQCSNTEQICCDTSCSGSCQSCLQALTGSPDGTCDTVASGTECQPVGCSNAVETTVAGTCDGSGQCGGAQTSPCAPYQCDGNGQSCRTSCTSSGDCTSGNYCDGANDCVPKKGAGQPCGQNSECQSDQCPSQDDLCCATSCGGLCRACVGSKTGGADGTCGFVTAGTDPDNECGGATPNCNGAAGCI